jgi:multicomponent K+:H+ antiporter subunit G
MILDIIISALLVIGGAFALVGSWGLVKLPDTMTRLHAPTKATTVGVGSVLIVSMIMLAQDEGGISFHELLITLFLFLTAPITAHFLAKAHLHRAGRKSDLPPTGTGAPWAGFDGSAKDAPHDSKTEG